MSTREKPVNPGRHQRNCSICRHAQREEIEAAFVSWQSPATIAGEYGLADRASVYRHAHALGLFAKRQRNVRAALERIIEKAGEVPVSASAVVSAVQAYAKINDNGQWGDRSVQVNFSDSLRERSDDELRFYLREGAWPDSVEKSVSATGLYSQR